MSLTKKQREVLSYLYDNPEEDIVMEGRVAFYGNNVTNVKLVYALLRLCAISQDSYSDIRYILNETGKKLLK